MRTTVKSQALLPCYVKNRAKLFTPRSHLLPNLHRIRSLDIPAKTMSSAESLVYKQQTQQVQRVPGEAIRDRAGKASNCRQRRGCSQHSVLMTTTAKCLIRKQESKPLLREGDLPTPSRNGLGACMRRGHTRQSHKLSGRKMCVCVPVPVGSEGGGINDEPRAQLERSTVSSGKLLVIINQRRESLHVADGPKPRCCAPERTLCLSVDVHNIAHGYTCCVGHHNIITTPRTCPIPFDQPCTSTLRKILREADGPGALARKL